MEDPFKEYCKPDIYPILDTRIYIIYSPSVTLRVPPWGRLENSDWRLNSLFSKTKKKAYIFFAKK